MTGRRVCLACLATAGVAGAFAPHAAFSSVSRTFQLLGKTHAPPARRARTRAASNTTPLGISMDTSLEEARRSPRAGPSGRAGLLVSTPGEPPRAGVAPTTPQGGIVVVGVVHDTDEMATVSTGGTLSTGRKRKGKEPELVIEGDMLTNTPKMIILVYTTIGLLVASLVQGLSTVASPWQAVWTALAAVVGYLIADLVSGVFHWSVDNYGDGDTPVFGSVIEAFQGHHASPWTITYRPFENNVHKICYAVLPLLALLRLANPGPAGVALGVTFLLGSLMSQEFHRYAHMTAPPPAVAALQNLGLIVSRKKHGVHHASPYEEKYCIVSGACNEPLDKTGTFRFMEKLIFEWTGVEPICWKLDPSIKEAVLSGGR